MIIRDKYSLSMVVTYFVSSYINIGNINILMNYF